MPLDNYTLARNPGPLSPRAALQAALQNAFASARRQRVDADDVASSALLDLLERRVPFDSEAIAGGVLEACRTQASRLRADRRMCAAFRHMAQRQAWPDEGTADPWADGSHSWIERHFRDGTTALLWRESESGGRARRLLVTLPNGEKFQNGDATRRAHEALLREGRPLDRPQQKSNTDRAIAALSRDALLLSVTGLPWRDALDQLRAAGVEVSRDGLRSGQRAARLRCAGKAAHARAREGELTAHCGDGDASLGFPAQ